MLAAIHRGQDKTMEPREAAAAAASQPSLSVVLITRGTYDALRETVRHLRAQTVAGRLELVLVTPSRRTLTPDASDMACFGAWKTVEADTARSLAPARCAAIRAAGAPVVAFAEDHCYPDPGWAEALIAAHRAPWAAVGPALGNANPATMVSWANFFIGYGAWIEPVKSGTVGDLSEHNTSYKRDLLLAFGADLERLLEREGGLHRALKAGGHGLYLEPAARALHRNFSSLPPSLSLCFCAGRLFGTTRAGSGRWPLPRRLLYVAGAPLIPLMRLGPVLRQIRRSGRGPELLPAILPALLALLTATGLGEAAGYACGPGAAARRLTDFEFGRDAYLAKRDRGGREAAPGVGTPHPRERAT